MIGTACVKLKPESTTSIHSAGGRPGIAKRAPWGINDAAMNSVKEGRGRARMLLAGASVIRLEFIFLKDKLVVHVLKVGQIEVRLCY
jgi:hypothetical protein